MQSTSVEPCDLGAVEARRAIGVVRSASCDRRRAIGAGELSPVELLASWVARIEDVEPAVNTLIALDRDGARRVPADGVSVRRVGGRGESSCRRDLVCVVGATARCDHHGGCRLVVGDLGGVTVSVGRRSGGPRTERRGPPPAHSSCRGRVHPDRVTGAGRGRV